MYNSHVYTGYTAYVYVYRNAIYNSHVYTGDTAYIYIYIYIHKYHIQFWPTLCMSVWLGFVLLLSV